MFLDAKGEWAPLSDNMRAQLITLGITLPTVTVGVGNMPITIVGSLSAYILTLDATIYATLDVLQTMLVTASSVSVLLAMITVKTVSTITLYAAYVSLSATTATVSVSNITVQAGATTAINYRTTEFNRQYGLNQIGADHAYQRGYFGQGVTVWIVDSGMRITHMDLTANLVPGRRSDASGNQGRFHAETALGEAWRGFADYQFGWTEAKTASGSIIEDISLRFDGWRIGDKGRSLFGMPFAAEMLMKIGVIRHPRIRSGNVHLRYGVSGDESVFIEDYQYSLLSGYNTVDRELSLTGATATTYQWGIFLCSARRRGSGVWFGIHPKVRWQKTPPPQ